jgi:hypothetical protein
MQFARLWPLWLRDLLLARRFKLNSRVPALPAPPAAEQPALLPGGAAGSSAAVTGGAAGKKAQ